MTSEPDDLEERLRLRQERATRWTQAWLMGPQALRYRGFVVAWAIAVAARATLLPGQGLAFLPHVMLMVVACAGLLRWGGRVFWLISLVALLHPLWFLRDWLTQTTIMTLIAIAGVLCTTGTHSDSDARRVSGPIVIATYFLAAFHKLNDGFLDPALSCAVYGWEKLGWLSHFPVDAFAGLHPWMPHLVLGTELLVFALLWAKPRFGIALAALFHIPLTIALAPAFAFVMAIGWAALLDDTQLRALREELLERWKLIAAITVVLTAGFVLGGVLWISAFKSAVLVTMGGLALRLPPPATAPAEERPWVAPVFVLIFALNGMLPYLGTQMQHSGAMLSNLRIDEGCWNHVVIPESARIVDPYVRIDAAYLDRQPGEPVLDEEREAVLRDTLWSTTALHSMRRNWCPTPEREIRLEGRFRGEPLIIESLCDPDEPLPRGPGSFGGAGFFDGYLRLQKNLTRDCPTACVH